MARRGLMPATPEGVFSPPEAEQKSELATATVARRLAEGLARRGPLQERDKKLGGELVHYGFGAGWGALYGLALESLPGGAGGPLGALAFGTIAWGLGDNLVVPFFRLGAWPQKYPARIHAHAFTAHAVYGLGTWAAWKALGPALWTGVAAAAWLLVRRRQAAVLPKIVRPAAKKALGGLAALRAFAIPRASAVAQALR
jgi:hypothetical protein